MPQQVCFELPYVLVRWVEQIDILNELGAPSILLGIQGSLRCGDDRNRPAGISLELGDRGAASELQHLAAQALAGLAAHYASPAATTLDDAARVDLATGHLLLYFENCHFLNVVCYHAIYSNKPADRLKSTVTYKETPS